MSFRISRGFTLIELLFVVAIISLLTVVVLASITEARERAKGRAFISEVNEFVKALELYRADNGKYPSQGATQFTHGYRWDGVYNNNGTTGAVPSIQAAMAPYIPNLPKPTVNNGTLSYVWRAGVQCEGDAAAATSPYYILAPVGQPGVEDWPGYIYLGTPNANFKCFSLK